MSNDLELVSDLRRNAEARRCVDRLVTLRDRTWAHLADAYSGMDSEAHQDWLALDYAIRAIKQAARLDA